MTLRIILAVCWLMSMQAASDAQSTQRSIIPAKPLERRVDKDTMRRIYEQVKTPHKYGVVLKAEKGRKVDCPSVFRFGDKWYMMYIIFDGNGYETAIADSNNLLRWRPLGRILSFRKGTWDAMQAAGYIALQDHTWAGSNELEKFEGKYWLSYIGGALKGYRPISNRHCLDQGPGQARPVE